MRHSIAVTVNGVRREDAVEPRLLLVHYLREVAGLTGTHIGCDTSQCGACTVIVDGRAVKSCSVFAVQADGRSVTTVEGLADGAKLHPIQQAFIDKGALQCAYCTPGLVLSTKSLLDEHPHATEEEMREYLAGNLCRCTGYVKILEAAMAAKAHVQRAAKPPGVSPSEAGR